MLCSHRGLLPIRSNSRSKSSVRCLRFRALRWAVSGRIRLGCGADVSQCVQETTLLSKKNPKKSQLGTFKQALHACYMCFEPSSHRRASHRFTKGGLRHSDGTNLNAFTCSSTCQLAVVTLCAPSGTSAVTRCYLHSSFVFISSHLQSIWLPQTQEGLAKYQQAPARRHTIGPNKDSPKATFGYFR